MAKKTSARVARYAGKGLEGKRLTRKQQLSVDGSDLSQAHGKPKKRK